MLTKPTRKKEREEEEERERRDKRDKTTTKTEKSADLKTASSNSTMLRKLLRSQHECRGTIPSSGSCFEEGAVRAMLSDEASMLIRPIWARMRMKIDAIVH